MLIVANTVKWREMMSKPDANQASEAELEQYLLNDKAFQHILKSSPNSQRELMNFELARYINALIRTEKLKLLAEVRERVVGEDVTLNSFEIPVYEGGFVITSVTQQNNLRADQRILLDKLEAEL